MNGPRAVHRFLVGPADEPRQRDVVQQGIGTMPLKPEDSPLVEKRAGSRPWAVTLIASVSERVTRLVRRPSPPEPSTRTLFEEANLGLASLQDDFDAGLRDLEAANWDELGQQLDRINDVLRSLVEDVAGRPAPPPERD